MPQPLETWAVAVASPDGHTAILSKRYPLNTDAITAAAKMTRSINNFRFTAIQMINEP
jgi:hypothetical protein